MESIQAAITKADSVSRFMALLSGINALWKEESFLQLLREEKLPDRPELAGDFHYES